MFAYLNNLAKVVLTCAAINFNIESENIINRQRKASEYSI